MTQKSVLHPNREIAKSRRLPIVLALGLCYFVHLFPFNVFVFFQPLHPLWILAGIVALIAGRLILPRYAPLGYRVGGYVYYAVVVANLAFLTYFIWLLDSSFFFVWLPLMSLSGGFLYYWGEKRFWLLVFLAPAIYPFLLPDGTFFMKAFAVLGVAALAPALLLHTPKRIGRTALLFAVAIGLLLARVELFYYHADPSLLSAVKSQERVQTILTLDRSGQRKARSLIGKQIRFVADDPSGRHTLIGGSSGLVAVNRDGSSPRLIFSGMTGDGLAYAPAAGLLVVGDYANERLVWLHDADLSPAASIASPDRAFTNVWIDESAGLVLTGDDFTREIGVFALDGRSPGRFLESRSSRDALRDENTGELIAATLRRVRWLDAATGAMRRELAVPSFQIRLEIDAPRRLLYISAFSAGEVWRVNLDSGRVETKLKLEPGVRFLRLTPDKNTLFAANYLTGRIHQLAVPELRIERVIEGGPRVRSLHIAPGASELAFGSSLGAFRYRFGD